MIKKKLAIVTTHPIQYQTPLFKEISYSNKFKVDVYFASKHGYQSKYIDKDFKKKFNWNINLLSGYNYFFSGKSYQNINSFFLSFKNLNNTLFKKKYDAILIFGWNNIFYLKSFFLAKLNKIPIILRVETNFEDKINFFKKIIKYFILNIFFKYINFFLYIGTLNKKFYLDLRVNKNKLYPSPYAVDNHFFANKQKVKVTINKKFKKKIILFVGKFIERKNILEFLNLAILFKNDIRFNFLMVGHGHQIDLCNQLIKNNKLSNIKIAGFKNQIELKEIYKKSFLLIVPSKYETWGLVVNEAMASGLPVICSRNCSSSRDLIINGKTGYVYNLGDLKLVQEIINFLANNKKKYLELVNNINKHIKNFSFSHTIKSLDKILYEKI
jgi:glycosyltransferase involved in cell wall biosynthesis